MLIRQAIILTGLVMSSLLVKEGSPTSITIRQAIDIPPELRTISLAAWEEKASQFLKKYFNELFHDKAIFSSPCPPTEYLEHIQGYVTGSRHFWENVEIKLEIIRFVGDKLLIQCSISGQYVKLDTRDITDGAFERPNLLENDYSHEINSLGLNIINDFNKSIKPEQCTKIH